MADLGRSADRRRPGLAWVHRPLPLVARPRRDRRSRFPRAFYPLRPPVLPRWDRRQPRHFDCALVGKVACSRGVGGIKKGAGCHCERSEQTVFVSATISTLA